MKLTKPYAIGRPVYVISSQFTFLFLGQAIEGLQQDIEDLDSQLTASKDKETAAKALEQTVASLQSQLKVQHKGKKSLEADKQRAHQAIEVLRKDMAAVRQQLAHAQNEGKNVQSLGAKCMKLEQDLHEKMRQLQSLQLSRQGDQKALAALQDEVQKSRTAAENSRRELQVASLQVSNLEKMEAQLKEKAHALGNLQSQCRTYEEVSHNPMVPPF